MGYGKLTRQIQWEIDTSQHNGEENVPSADTCDESKSTSSFGKLDSKVRSAIGKLEVARGKETKCGHKCEEDKEEDEVRANRADEVDEAQDAHHDEEVCCINR
jgi:hypothetical protein